jgi:hypothetical protein
MNATKRKTGGPAAGWTERDLEQWRGAKAADAGEAALRKRQEGRMELRRMRRGRCEKQPRREAGDGCEKLQKKGDMYARRKEGGGNREK